MPRAKRFECLQLLGADGLVTVEADGDPETNVVHTLIARRLRRADVPARESQGDGGSFRDVECFCGFILYSLGRS